MFSSPENDKKIKIANLILSVVAVVLIAVFGFTVIRDNTTEQKEMTESIQKSKQ